LYRLIGNGKIKWAYRHIGLSPYRTRHVSCILASTMKLRITLSILLFIGGITFLAAQPKVDFGLHGGVLVSNMPGFTNTGFRKVSGTAGVIITRRDKYKNYVQVEINYIRKGAFRKEENDNPNKYNLSLHYVEIPVFYRMEKFALTSRNGQEQRVGVDIGLSYARLISPRMFKNGDQVAFNEIWSDKYDLSALFGVHLRVNNRMYFDARYSFSINPILRRNVLPYDIHNFNSQQTHSHVIQVGVSFYMRGRYY
jgi:hypothetical protein